MKQIVYLDEMFFLEKAERKDNSFGKDRHSLLDQEFSHGYELFWSEVDLVFQPPRPKP